MPIRQIAAILVLALLAAGCASLHPAPTTRPQVLLVSIDGLRADVVGSGAMPNLDRIAREGVHARWMNPSYPTLTFPNHYTLVTGLRPDHHGIVHNTMRDQALGKFSLANRAAVEDARWWGGEPVWVSLQKQGGHAATMFWPGSEAPIAGQHPQRWRRFDDKVTPSQRVDTVLDWLSSDSPRPDFVTLYFNQVDSAEHEHGPHSPEARAAEQEVDAALARLLAGLDARGLRERVDLIIVSDHGMATVPTGQVAWLDDLAKSSGIDPAAVDTVSQGEVIGIVPRDEATARALVGRHPHSSCWRKQDLPPQWHYGSNPRIPPIVCQPDVGWVMAWHRDGMRVDADRGAHGYPPEAPQMHAVFVADGPAFRSKVELTPFDNVDVYPLLVRLLGIRPQPNDGDITPLLPALSASE